VLVLLLPSPAEAATGTVREGNARFQVITPTLIRLEYAADGRFEDRPSLNVVDRRRRWRRYRVRRSRDLLTIRTGRLTPSTGAARDPSLPRTSR